MARRVAIVTGAARGIGAETARELARRGCTVAVLDVAGDGARRTAAAIRADGGEALAVVADVADSAQGHAAVEEVARELGPPAVLVNNAGVIRDNLLHRMTDDDWDTVLAVHLRGAFVMSRSVQAHLTTQPHGRIVNVSSTSAIGLRGQANYSAAKAGLQGFTKTLALELGPFGVTVNAVAPGFIATDMTAAAAARTGTDVDELHRRAAARIALRRIGRPADVAKVIAFLASHDAGYVSGQVVYVAGGPVA